MRKTLLASGLAAAFILVGCGGGSDATTTTTDTIGYVVDAPVQNMNYDCVADGTENHATGADGAFTCQNMSQVRFRLGNLVLGEISGLPQDGYVFPQDIVGVDRANLEDARVTAMAQLLQSLDEDGNLDNGIQIPQDVGNQFSAETFTATQLGTYLDEASVSPVRVRTELRARQHLRDSMLSVGVAINNSTFDINSYPMYPLTQELNDTIVYMGNEERMAYDVYTNLYTYHINNGIEIKQLLNIPENSESRHIEIVQSIVRKYNLDATTVITNPVADSNVTLAEMPSGEYGVPAVQALYDALYAKGITSKQAALEAGCMVEVTDVNDLNADIELAIEAGAEDIVAAYNILRDGSYNHYWAFDKGLKNMGVTDGCCSLGTVDGVNYCHPEYPQISHGNGNQ